MGSMSLFGNEKGKWGHYQRSSHQGQSVVEWRHFIPLKNKWDTVPGSQPTLTHTHIHIRKHMRFEESFLKICTSVEYCRQVLAKSQLATAAHESVSIAKEPSTWSPTRSVLLFLNSASHVWIFYGPHACATHIVFTYWTCMLPVTLKLIQQRSLINPHIFTISKLSEAQSVDSVQKWLLFLFLCIDYLLR